MRAVKWLGNSAMRVEVRLFATLAAFLPPDGRAGAAVLDLPEGSIVADVPTRLGIPPDMPWVPS